MNRRDFFKTAAVGVAGVVGLAVSGGTVMQTRAITTDGGEFGLSLAMKPEALRALRELNKRSLKALERSVGNKPLRGY